MLEVSYVILLLLILLLILQIIPRLLGHVHQRKCLSVCILEHYLLRRPKLVLLLVTSLHVLLVFGHRESHKPLIVGDVILPPVPEAGENIEVALLLIAPHSVHVIKIIVSGANIKST